MRYDHKNQNFSYKKSVILKQYLGNPKILIQNFQVNKKLIKMYLGKGSVIKQ